MTGNNEIEDTDMINGNDKLELSQDFDDDDMVDGEEVQVKTSAAANNNQIALDISNEESYMWVYHKRNIRKFWKIYFTH